MDSIFSSPTLMGQPRENNNSKKRTPTISQRKDEFEGSRERTDVSINKHRCQGTKNKKIYPSPVWIRDSTNRLQRKSIRKSLSLESAIDQIGESDSEETNINDGTPRWQRLDYECSRKLRRDLMPVQNKNVFSSTINNGDNRLQRKSIHRILSFESAINQIGESELVVTDFDDTICNSTNINDRTPRRQRVENECSMKLRRNLMTVQNRNIFSSTVNNGYSPKAVPESNTNPAPLFDSNKENSTANNQRIRKRKFKIGNTLSAWSPFWDRNNTSSRLSRRHYVTDFLDSMEQ